MTPVLTLGLALYASAPLTLGDLGRASEVARANVADCRQLPANCATPSDRSQLAREIAVLYAEGRVLDGVSDPVLAADVHALAPDLAEAWVGAKPAVAPEAWIESLVAMPFGKAKVPFRPATQVAARPPDWAIGPVPGRSPDMAPEEIAPPRVLRLADVEKAAPSDAWLAFAQGKRVEAIHMLDDLMARHGRSADLVFRMAELSDEESRYEQMLELDQTVSALEACDDTWCQDSVMQPDHRGSEGWRAQAIRLYAEVERTWPRFKQVDRALYHYALALRDSGQPDEALQALIRLARSYPESVHAQDAYLLIGETHFDAGRVWQALSAYEMAFQHPDPLRREFAQYKAAWCQYNLGQSGDAYATLARIVESEIASPDEAARYDDGTTVHDLAMFAAEAGQVDPMVELVQALDPARVPSAIDVAARRLADNGRIGEAVRTWRRVEDLARRDGATDAERHAAKVAQRNIVSLALDAANSSGLDDELARLVRDVAIDPLARDKGETEALVALLRRAEIRFHHECRSGQPESCDFAENAYVSHLALGPERSIAAELHYELGELLYRKGDFLDAYRHYEALLALDPHHPKAQFCAEAAIQAADHALAFTVRPKVEGVEPRRLTVDEERLLKALDAYVDAWPNTDHAAGAAYRAGYILYEANHLEEARGRFREVVRKAPASPDAEFAAQLVLDSLSLQGKWTELRDWAQRFHATPGLGGKPGSQNQLAVQADVESVLARATLRVADELAAAGGSEKAARAYLDFADTWPASPLAAKALNNAAVAFDAAGLDELAAQARHRLLDAYPGSAYTPEHLAALGVRAERRGDFENATTYYEALADGYPDSPGARDARYSAALFRWASGDAHAAAADYDAFVTTWPDDPRVPGIRFDVVRMFQEAGLHEHALARARALVGEADPARGLFARTKVIQSLQALGREAEASLARTEADGWASAQPRTPELEGLLGGLRLMDVYDAYAALTADKLPAEPATPGDAERLLSRRMADKLQKAVALEAAVAHAVEAGDVASAEAAWALLGQGFEDVGDTIRNAPVPGYLSDAQRSLFLTSVRDRAWTFEERAVEAYSKVVETADRFDTYDDAVRLSLEARHRLRPDRFDAPFDEALPVPRFVSVVEPGLETEL
jgi:TolA-binding protein